MGVRYFLDQPVFRYPVYIAYSDDSYWDSNRFRQAKAGHLPDDLLVFVVVPSQYDTALAPEGRQCVLAATLCSPDPSSAGGPDADLLWNKLEETVERLWPEIIPHVESKERYSTAQVSALTRDQVLPGQGGECIGLAQIVGQCGRHKPSPRAPLRGLYFVGCDAGGYGCGTHQAVDSAVKVTPLVLEEHRARNEC
jgi:prolycopene isomerase